MNKKRLGFLGDEYIESHAYLKKFPIFLKKYKVDFVKKLQINIDT